MKRGPTFKDIGGQRFGRLTAMKVAPKTTRHTQWYCKCDCGRGRVTSYTELTKGQVTQCKKCTEAMLANRLTWKSDAEMIFPAFKVSQSWLNRGLM